MSNFSFLTEPCDPAKGKLEGCSFEDRLLDTEYVTDALFKWQHIVFLFYIFFFLYLARWTYQFKLWLYFRMTNGAEDYGCAVGGCGVARAGLWGLTRGQPPQLRRGLQEGAHRGRQQGPGCFLLRSGAPGRRVALAGHPCATADEPPGAHAQDTCSRSV